MPQTVCYEQPLNERVRSLLRLELLFQQVNHAVAGPSTWDSREALRGLFDILDLIGRNELKSELLKEMDRYVTILNRLRQTPSVHVATLNSILLEIGQASDRLRRLDNQALDAVRKTSFLSTIHKRIQIPGGACRFDLPALHHWLQHDPEVRARHLREWLAPFDPLWDAVALILRLIRDSAVAQPEMACGGFFQLNLDSNASNQIIRVFLPFDDTIFPEISGGRHRFTIRFLEQPDPNHRAVQSTDDIPFELACCAI